ncbi:MAG: hypothetical protein HY314_17600 [Acidobacteria bacterium]|nr:hypothetical protein [Acidobacteriota bacterium]
MIWTYDFQGMEFDWWAEIVVPLLEHDAKPGDIFFFQVGEGTEADEQIQKVGEMLQAYGYDYKIETVMGVRTMIFTR